MNLKEFRDLLLTVHPAVYHFESHKESEYIVWHEVGSLSLMGDGAIAERGTRIAVDYFTKDEYDQVHEALEITLAAHDDICMAEPAVDFDKESGLIHYAYTCEVM